VDFFALLQNQVGFFMLIFVRITGIFLMAPVFGSKNVNTYIKAGLALVITYILFPLAFNSNIVIPEHFVPYLFIVLGELIVGLIIGFVSSLVFSAIQMSGQLLDMQIGFGVINIIDPQSGGQIPLIGNFKYILALLIFLATNGHHVLLSALFTSFKLIPVTGVIVHTNLTEFIVRMVSGTFVIALKISMPILITIIITDIALGILARTMPQMNIFVVGVPVKILIGLFVLSLALPFYIIFLEMAFDGMYKDIFQVLSLFG
jgi:flagellar biosynthetic protein FliR